MTFCAALATPWLSAGAASLGVPADFGMPVTKGGALYLNFSRDGQQRLLEVCVCVCVDFRQRRVLERRCCNALLRFAFWHR